MENKISELLLIEKGISKEIVFSLQEEGLDIDDLIDCELKKAEITIENSNNLNATEKENKRKIIKENIQNLLAYEFLLDSEHQAKENNMSHIDYIEIVEEALSKSITKSKAINIFFYIIVVATILISKINKVPSNYAMPLSIAINLALILMGLCLYIPNKDILNKITARRNLIKRAKELM